MTQPKLDRIVFIDVETVSQKAELNENSPAIIELWNHKHQLLYKNDPEITPEQSYRGRAAIFAEFGKIICISIGLYHVQNGEFRIKSIYNDDEVILLNEFIELCDQLKGAFTFCGHNIREFDIPYISRRLIVNRLKIPKIMDFQALKPWEVNCIDTLQMWKFGDYKHYTSLHMLTTILGIPSPKETMDGSEVGDYYWKRHQLLEIKKYCEKDVAALIYLYLRLINYDLGTDFKITYVE